LGASEGAGRASVGSARTLGRGPGDALPIGRVVRRQLGESLLGRGGETPRLLVEREMLAPRRLAFGDVIVRLAQPFAARALSIEEAVDGLGDEARVGGPLFGAAAQTREHEVVERRRKGPGAPTQARRVGATRAAHGARQIAIVAGEPACADLEAAHAERNDVAATVERLPACLFRRRVLGTPGYALPS